MAEIEFSFMGKNQRADEMLRAQLDEFESQTGIHVHLRSMTWESGRGELTRAALYHHGPDVSEIGTTWVGDFMAMNALRSFSEAEVTTYGPAEDFLPSAWQTCHLYGSKETFAIPWHAETFMLHYRRDYLQKAGVDEAAAFRTHADFEETIRRLCKAGVPVPFEFPMTGSFTILHLWASWLWGAGADICTPDGKRTLFTEPEAMKATRSFMGLMKYIPQEGINLLRSRGNLGPFLGGKSAVFYLQPNALTLETGLSEEIQNNWGLAELPSAHFTGGSNLVIWRHASDDRACLELVNFLTRPEMLLAMPTQFPSLPPRRSVLEARATRGDLLRRVTAESLLTGRSFPSVPLLGLIESRLTSALTQITNSYAANPDQDPGDIAEKALTSAARKLDVTLSQ